MTDIFSFKPKRILCPLDFSELSDLALKYAAVAAREYDATLHVLHARHQPFLEATFFGRTTELVVRQASCPVLITPRFSAS
ncbi:MAG: universal stress protein [Proteobacteria bacterium]|nr:universal stress protein [Pseudomonadota bacterium]